ncbi:MAG: hypothetical protein ACREOO_02240 [bacterium]
MAAKTYHLTLWLMMLVAAASAEVRRVPQQYNTIQAAIHAAVNGDTVLVEPGTYFENIRFVGKRILVASRFVLKGEESFIRETIINGSRPQHPDTASCMLFINREDSTATLAGFIKLRTARLMVAAESGSTTFCRDRVRPISSRTTP